MGRPRKDHSREVLLFVSAFIAEHGYAPTVRQISAGIGLSARSVGQVHACLTNLEAKGFIRRLPKRVRAIEIMRAPSICSSQYDADLENVRALRVDPPSFEGITLSNIRRLNSDFGAVSGTGGAQVLHTQSPAGNQHSEAPA